MDNGEGNKKSQILREMHSKATKMLEIRLTYFRQEKYNFSTAIATVCNPQSGVAKKVTKVP